MNYKEVRKWVSSSRIGAAFAVVLIPVPTQAQQSAPVIDSVTFRENAAGRHPVVYPELHFHDASGTVRYIHREVVATNSPKPLGARDGLVDVSAKQQVQGAIFVGGWQCGAETYYVTLRAFMVNLDGARSNVVEYTIHCNGG